MRAVQIEVSMQKHDTNPRTTVTKKVLIDQFDSIEEAINTLGELEVLKSINFMHELKMRNKIRKQM